MLVTQIENKIERNKKIGFELIVETSLGITNLDNIITGSKRIESLHFGYADYAASVRMRTTNIGGPNPDLVHQYWLFSFEQMQHNQRTQSEVTQFFYCQ